MTVRKTLWLVTGLFQSLAVRKVPDTAFSLAYLEGS
jgi:hypothetical protein